MGTGYNRSLILGLISEDAERDRMDVVIPGIRKDSLQYSPSADQLKLPIERLGLLQTNCYEVKYLLGNEGRRLLPKEKEIDASHRKSDGEPRITLSGPRHD